MKLAIVMLAVFVLCLSGTTSQSAVPNLVTFQGLLTDSLGIPLSDGLYDIEFFIYDAAVSGNSHWTSGTRKIYVFDGLFSYNLGDTVALPDSLFLKYPNLWLAVKVGTNPEMSPRTKLVSSAYSIKARHADTADFAHNVMTGSFLPLSGGTMTGPITNTGDPEITMGKGNFGANNTNTGTNAFVAGENNTASGWIASVGGGIDNLSNDSATTISGGRNNTANGRYSAIAGGTNNVTGGTSSFVGGGEGNVANIHRSTVCGGLDNTATGNTGATVVGGARNIAASLAAFVGGGESDSAMGKWSSVLGGYGNKASGDYASVGGGLNNIAADSLATIAGGSNNTAGALEATVSGGARNVANGPRATVGGGENGTASGGNSTIGGGHSNAADGTYSSIGGGSSNEASGQWSTVGGGSNNTASLDFATVGGGDGNSATGFSATIPGGRTNSASGGHSFVAGVRDTATGWYATVGGGSNNLAEDSASTVAGGKHNKARGLYSTVGGGGGFNPADSNSAIGARSIVGGGARNVASGSSSTIAGGFRNSSANLYSAVGGGIDNVASGIGAAVAGGSDNVSAGIRSTVGGGGNDTATGDYATIPGGLLNKAAGNYSFAAGYRAKALHPGTFVWGDGTSADFISTNADQFLIRAAGGVGFGTNNPQGKLHMAETNWSSAPVRISGLTGSSVGPTLTIDATNGTNGNSFSIISTNSGAGAGGGKLAIYDDAPGTFGYRLVIDSTGDVGIGTTNPEARLHVGGGTASQILLDNQGDLMWKDISGIPKAVLSHHSDNNVYLDAPGEPASAIIFRTSSTPFQRMHISATGVAIGPPSATAAIDASRSGGTVAIFDRTSSDGTVVSIRQGGITEGTISVSGTTVSYNAFTGSHYGWTDEKIKRGELVTMSGDNQTHHDNPESEIIYGIKKSEIANDPACLGSYLALSEPGQPYSVENPHLVMAVGNGDMWITDESGAIKPGDYLISSSTPGHAMKDDDDKFPIGHIVARAAESVDWSSVSETIDGRKHKKISVLFGNFVRSNSAELKKTIAIQQKQLNEQNDRIARLEASMLRSHIDN